MNEKRSPAAILRELIARPGLVRSAGAHDVLTALILERAGFPVLFVGGFGTSASAFGLPDLGFLGMSEMAEVVRRMCARVQVPVIADGDTGHGDLHNVVRTVEEFERAGAAGIILEDQIFPKRCGHFEGKQVISAAAMVTKLRAAVRARRDPDFVIIARTDAGATHGLEEAIARIRSYCEAGADVAFIEAPQSREEIETIARTVEYPKFINLLSFGKTPIVSATELEELGYKFVVAPIATVLMQVKALERVARAVLDDGHAMSLRAEMASFGEVKELLGVHRWLDLPRELGEASEGGDAS